MGNNHSKELLDDDWVSIERDGFRDYATANEVESQKGGAEDKFTASAKATQLTAFHKIVGLPWITQPCKAAEPALSNSTASAGITARSKGMRPSVGMSVAQYSPQNQSEPVTSQVATSLTQDQPVILKLADIDGVVDGTALAASKNAVTAPKTGSCPEGQVNHKPMWKESSKKEVKESYRSCWSSENQTYPEGILRKPVSVQKQKQVACCEEGSKPPTEACNQAKALGQWTKSLPLRTASRAYEAIESAEDSNVREKARALHDELVQTYSRRPDFNDIIERILNDPETSLDAIRKIIKMLEMTKQNVDRADEIVRKMGLRPGFCSSCREWKDRDWESWKDNVMCQIDAKTRFEQIREIVVDAKLFEVHENQFLAQSVEKSREYVVAALWETFDPRGSIMNRLWRVKNKL